jgi:hypothetical protein
MTGMANIKQFDNETVTAFADRVKSRMATFWNTIDTNGEPICHDLALEYAKADNPLRTTATDDDQKKARESTMAYMIISKANDKRFKPLKDNLETNQTQDVAKYPDTVTKAMEFTNPSDS